MDLHPEGRFCWIDGDRLLSWPLFVWLRIIREMSVSNDVVTLDLYCLNCGYNLRGLAGDPRRCPECGHLNRVEDLEVPAKLIRRALRRLESGVAICGASASTLLLWVVPLLIVMVDPPMTRPPVYVWIFVTSLGAVSIVLYVIGMFHFRRSCGHKSRWFPMLLRFTVLACLIAACGLAAIVSFVLGIKTAIAMRPASPLNLLVAGRIVVAVALLAVSTWLYRVGKRSIHPLQRETAARFARARYLNEE